MRRVVVLINTALLVVAGAIKQASSEGRVSKKTQCKSVLCGRVTKKVHARAYVRSQKMLYFRVLVCHLNEVRVVVYSSISVRVPH